MRVQVGADPTKYENANAVRLEYQFLPRWSFEATYGDAKSGFRRRRLDARLLVPGGWSRRTSALAA